MYIKPVRLSRSPPTSINVSVEHDIPTQTMHAKVFAHRMVNAPIFARVATTVVERIGVVADDDIEVADDIDDDAPTIFPEEQS